MSNFFNSIRLLPRDGEFLGRNVGNSGELYFNRDEKSLRVYDGKERGGFEVISLGNANLVLGNAEIASLKYSVTVSRNTENTANVYYIDGVENPSLVLVKGITYVFDQSDISNVTYGGNQPHPLAFSTNDNGDLVQGGSVYEVNVFYILDGLEVTREKYLQNFAVAEQRQVIIGVKNATPEELYYFCAYHLGMGNSIEVGAPGSGSGGASVQSSITPPEEPENGAVWFNSETGRLYVYLVDIDSGQWVQPVIPLADSILDLNIVDGTEGQVLTTDGNGGFTFEDAASGGIEEGSDVSLGVVTADSVLATSITSTGVGVANFSSTSSITLDAQDGVIVDGELDVNGLATLQQTTEVTLALTGATGVVDHNISNGTVFDHTSLSANFTANFTNVPTTNSRTISIALILNQGGTAYMPTAVQIDGSAQTILWQGGSAPSGTASGVDVVSFTLVRSTSGAWSVIGSGTSYS